MEEIKSRPNSVETWGYLTADEKGIILEASPDYCDHFSVKKEEIVGTKIQQLLKETSAIRPTERKRKKVIFARVLGYACLLRIHQQNNTFIYSVIFREDEVNLYEVHAFMNAIESKNRSTKSTSNNHYTFGDIIEGSPSMAHTKELAARIAASHSTVLITGESGTGKELFAQAIHQLSARKKQPFVAVNCAAIPDELFESEVFGYESGAFSGAKKGGKPGKIELAQHGTLFLDEISELPYQAQGKLLRVLQEREVERLGGVGSKYVDIRIVAATNRDLHTLVQEGEFRQDLFYRLYVFELRIPPLRQRREDILPLCDHFIESFNKQIGKQVTTLSEDMKERIVNYDWPGNVRELKAFIERGMNIVEGDTLTAESLFLSPVINLPHPSVEPNDPPPLTLDLKKAVEQAEITTIKQALKEADGDRSVASQKLNIHLASLYRKIAKYKLKERV
ncbi:sigma-54 interaction domain-containing protein [Desertibacillus haloalkaliphilus]|uniref:sigma-54 interaction domain-containing protein n=1 Tax=Desertibacillus haloalkaliphilus TaxID=1328930 RepID=UPI001C25AF2B|nr:sigma 54-interacting transcriptional regulator [Desertibacillus haloalkaliphilus]MBU8906063.1 sigma 54-interacting transcriptional regulator [Desertibacillus haloalkaliphilus]